MTEFERTFDSAAADYDKARPEYVKEIYDDILRYAPIYPDCDVMEIGLGTGKASRPMLDTQCRFVGLEPGKRLADIARNRYRGYENFTLFERTFQDHDAAERSFDLIFAATSFHWIPEEYGYDRVFRLLKPGGAFARFAYHAGPDRGRKTLTDEIQELYRKYMSASVPPAEFGLADAKNLAEKALKYGFTDIKYSLYHAAKDFTADEYMSLLRTYPDHMRLAASDRNKLFNGIHSAIVKHGGVMTVTYTMDLELARRPD